MIRKFLLLTIFSVSLLAAKAQTFNNPILAGFYPDPSICRVGNDYYITTSTFAYFPGLPIFHSTDLVNWKQIGNAMDRQEQLDQTNAGVSRGLFAPTIRYHKGTFYILCTLIDKKGNFIITAKDPKGPWSNPKWLPEVKGKDHSIDFVNNKAFEGTLLAHTDGGVPNLIVSIPKMDEYTFGYLVYFFEKACSMSGYLLVLNPFDQLGVEAYKVNMFALLGKPGFEEKKAELEKRLK